MPHAKATAPHHAVELTLCGLGFKPRNHGGDPKMIDQRASQHPPHHTA